MDVTWTELSVGFPLTASSHHVSAAVLLSSAVVSSVTDNIPLLAMLAKILAKLHTPGDSPLWWSVIFGANLGGNVTPIGSASTLVAVTIIHRHQIPLSFAAFVKAAFPFAALRITLAMVYVLVLLRYPGLRRRI